MYYYRRMYFLCLLSFFCQICVVKTYAQESETEIVKWVQRENKKCPVNANNGQIITKLSYKNKQLNVYATYDKSLLPFSSELLSSEKVSTFKRLMLKMLLLDQNNRLIINHLINSSATMKYNYISSSLDGKFSILFSQSELRNGYNKYSKLSDEMIYVEIQMETANLYLPHMIEDGIIYNRVYFDDNLNSIVMEYEIDETKHNFKNYQLNKTQLKTQAMIDIQSIITKYSNYKKTYEICSKFNKFIRYKYISNPSRSVVEIIITPAELHRIIN